MKFPFTPKLFWSFRCPAVFGALALVSSLTVAVPRAAAAPVSLSSLNITSWEQGWGRLQKDKDVDGGPLSIGGQVFATGLGTHAPGSIVLDLGGGSERFSAKVGVNDNPAGKGSVEFIVQGDGKVLLKSGVMRAGEAAKSADVSVKGVRLLVLEVTDGGDGIDYDHADWAEATLEVTGVQPKSYTLPTSEAVVLTPKPSAKPRINGPSIFGVRPGSPFLYSIPVTGDRPVTYAVEGLPAGLTLDAGTGRITGTLDKKATYTVTLRAKNALGQAEKTFRIVVGEDIALTPPMGWNSYNVWGTGITQDKALRSAKALVASGLVNHGWTYLNLDDGWQGVRGGPFKALQPDAKAFPNMRQFCDDLHALGLKVGIYHTPWVMSYGGRCGGSSEDPDGRWNPKEQWPGKNPPNKKQLPKAIGRYSFVEVDARQFAEWGIDYLKYDWAPVEAPETKFMADALRATRRDIVFSLSNNHTDTLFAGIKDVSVHAQSWRTTGDINDTWGRMTGLGFDQDKWAPFQRPGHFNDPDMLVVGQVGWGKPRPTRLTPDEQYTHMSLWCLLGAPLLIGADLEKLDDFTLGLLTNDEVLAVDQDALCQQAVRVAKDGPVEVYAKQLEDGSTAVGLFNRGLLPATGTVKWTDLKLPPGTRRVRDLWRQKDLGTFADAYSAPVAPHGVVFIRVD